MFACNKEQIHTAVLIYEVVYERVYQLQKYRKNGESEKEESIHYAWKGVLKVQLSLEIRGRYRLMLRSRRTIG